MSLILRLDIGIIQISIETQVEETVRTVHHIVLKARIMAFADIDRIAIRHHATIEPMVIRDRNPIDIIGLATIIGRQSNGTEFVPILGPTCLNGVGENAIQIWVATAVAVLVVHGEAAQLLSSRRSNAARVAQAEVMHRLGAI